MDIYLTGRRRLLGAIFAAWSCLVLAVVVLTLIPSGPRNIVPALGRCAQTSTAGAAYYICNTGQPPFTAPNR